MILTLTLTLPPSINGAYAQNADGKRVLTAHARQWKKQAGADIRAQLVGVRFMGTYGLAVKLSDLALPHDRDCDNTLKLMLDAFVKSGTVADDSHRFLRFASVEWSSAVTVGTCEVTIAELTREQSQSLRP